MNTTIPVFGFHHIALRVSDFDRSCAFYMNALGCTVAAAWNEAPKRVAMLDLGDDGRIEVFEGGEGEKIDTGVTPGAFFHLAMRTEDADLAYNRAIAAGAESVTPPKDVVLQSNPPLPARIAFVAGPDGETLEFFQTK